MNKQAKTIFLAGADGALGQAVLQTLVDSEYAVFATTYSSKAQQDLHNKYKNHQQSPTLATCDLANVASVQQALQAATQALGPIAHLINVAGGFIWSKISDCSDAQFDFLLDANVRANWLLLKHGASLLPPGGKVILVSAASSTKACDAGFGPYIGSKRFLNALVEAAALEYAARQISIVALMPTIIDTPRNRSDMPNADFTAWLKPEAVAQTMLEIMQGGRQAANGEFLELTAH